MDERTYDRIHNEGGEGYNPYRAERERRELEAEIARPKSIDERIDALYRRIDRECGSVAREWGNNEEIDAKAAEMRKEIAQLKTERDADFLAVWTLDETKTRREAWNLRVKKGEFGKTGSGKVDFKAVDAAYKTQGWTLDDLKRAVKIHKDAGRL